MLSPNTGCIVYNPGTPCHSQWTKQKPETEAGYTEDWKTDTMTRGSVRTRQGLWAETEHTEGWEISATARESGQGRACGQKHHDTVPHLSSDRHLINLYIGHERLD